MIPRRLILLSLAGLAGTAAMTGFVPAHRLNVLAEALLEGPPAPPRPDMPIFIAAEGKAKRLLGTGLGQISITTIYGPAYVRLAYPDGDVASSGSRQSCSALAIRKRSQI